MELHHLQGSIAKGIDWLAMRQLANGEFVTYRSDNDAMQNWIIADSTVFGTALVANSLLELITWPGVMAILEKTVKFFESQRDNTGLWNHFTIFHSYRQVLPQDIDDTALVSSLLRKMGRSLPPHQLYMLQHNKTANGLFYTYHTFRLRNLFRRQGLRLLFNAAGTLPVYLRFWAAVEASPSDVALVPNVNLLEFLGLNENTRAIVPFVNETLRKNEEMAADKWYRNRLTIYYFISRAWRSGIAGLEESRQIILKHLKGSGSEEGAASALDIALRLNTLLNCNVPPEDCRLLAENLIGRQQVTGNWERRLVYYGGPKKLSGWGSEELSTAFCIEALAKYYKLIGN